MTNEEAIAILKSEMYKHIAERYLHEACRYIGSNGGLILKCEFRETPTIEIVRCKDCEYRKKNTFCLQHDKYAKDDYGFCSWAKMKGGTD